MFHRWSNGGPMTWTGGDGSATAGVLNIGFTNYNRWESVNGDGDSITRRTASMFSTAIDAEYDTNSVILANGQYRFVVDILNYDLAKMWDDNTENPTNSSSDKGIKFALYNSNGDAAQIGILTHNALDSDDSEASDNSDN